MTLSSNKDMTPEDIETKSDAAQRAWIEHVEPIDKPGTVIDTYRSCLPEYCEETEKRLVRKIDRCLLPLVVIIYLFNYLDRNSITQARLYGLRKDTSRWRGISDRHLHLLGRLYCDAIAICYAHDEASAFQISCECSHASIDFDQ